MWVYSRETKALIILVTTRVAIASVTFFLAKANKPYILPMIIQLQKTVDTTLYFILQDLFSFFQEMDFSIQSLGLIIQPKFALGVSFDI